MHLSPRGIFSRAHAITGCKRFPLSHALRLVAAMLLATAVSVLAQQPEQKIPGNDWVQLFNEKDLTGWIPIGAESWTVEGDGILHGKGLTKAYG